jgi:hypothetical protein
MGEVYRARDTRLGRREEWRTCATNFHRYMGGRWPNAALDGDAPLHTEYAATDQWNANNLSSTNQDGIEGSSTFLWSPHDQSA